MTDITEESIRKRMRSKRDRLASWEETEWLLNKLDELRESHKRDLQVAGVIMGVTPEIAHAAFEQYRDELRNQARPVRDERLYPGPGPHAIGFYPEPIPPRTPSFG